MWDFVHTLSSICDGIMFKCIYRKAGELALCKSYSHGPWLKAIFSVVLKRSENPFPSSQRHIGRRFSADFYSTFNWQNWMQDIISMCRIPNYNTYGWSSLAVCNIILFLSPHVILSHSHLLFTHWPKSIWGKKVLKPHPSFSATVTRHERRLIKKCIFGVNWSHCFPFDLQHGVTHSLLL